MLSSKLLDLIERHADAIYKELIRDIRSNPYTKGYHRFSSEEIYNRAFDVYRNLGEWLLQKSDDDVKARYIDLGKSRFTDNIPLSQIVYALLLTRIHLVDFIRRHGLRDTTLEIYQEHELCHKIVRFFDKAVFYTVYGYGSGEL